MTDFELMLKNNYIREPNLQKYRSKHTQVPYIGPRHFEKFHLTVHMYSYQFLFIIFPKFAYNKIMSIFVIFVNTWAKNAMNGPKTILFV